MSQRGWRGRGRGRGRGRSRGGGGGGGGRVRSSQTVRRSVEPAEPSGPTCLGWSLYFPENDFTPDFPYLPTIRAFKRYFLERADVLLPGVGGERLALTLDYEALIAQFCRVSADGDGVDRLDSSTAHDDGSTTTLAADIRDQPDLVLRSLSLALYQVVHDLHTGATPVELLASDRAGEPVAPIPGYAQPALTVRLANFQPHTPMRRLKANLIGKFVALRGTIVRVGNVKQLVTTMTFTCNRCSAVAVLHLPGGSFTPPTSCGNPDCRSRSFAPDRAAATTCTRDLQIVRLQELMMDDRREMSGRIPRSIEVEFYDDLVDSCVPGDVVNVCGEVKVVATEDGKGKADQAMFVLYLEASSVAGPRQIAGSNGGDDTEADGSKSNGSDSSSDKDAMEFSIKELYAIQKIQEEPSAFRTVVNSLCPAIYGHSLVKAGLVLALFGGVRRFGSDKNRIPVRGDPHMLIVGDPGLGKSQMLQALSGAAPRGVYVCGNTTTTAGLTVSLHKDGGSGGDYALEAGALVLGDQGCCCIDEFDKMGKQHQALLEAMEQQCISIAKAGIVCSLPARTSIIAAANPVGGHYHKGRTVSENIKMSPALLSRFDLVFVLIDEADIEVDRMLSEHVMALHSGRPEERAAAASTPLSTPSAASSAAAAAAGLGPAWDGSDERIPLEVRLSPAGGPPVEPVPRALLRKYVAYARKYVHPQLSQQAASVLQNFYLDLRARHAGADSTPITARQIESLVRLAEARARSELREIVTEQDATDVVEIMRMSLFDTFADEYGEIDFSRSQMGSGMSKKAQAKHFIAELTRRAEESYNSLFTRDQLAEVSRDLGLSVGSFADFLSSLNNQGYLLKKGSRSYQLRTTDY